MISDTIKLGLLGAVVIGILALIGWLPMHAANSGIAPEITIQQQQPAANPQPDQKELEAPVAAIQQSLSNVVLNGYQGGTITNWGSVFRCQDGKSTWTSTGGISLTVPGCAGPSKKELHEKLQELDQQAVKEGRDFLRPDLAEWLSATQ